MRWGEQIDPAAPVNDYTNVTLDQVLPVSGQQDMSDYIYRAHAADEGLLRCALSRRQTCSAR